MKKEKRDKIREQVKTFPDDALLAELERQREILKTQENVDKNIRTQWKLVILTDEITERKLK